MKISDLISVSPGFYRSTNLRLDLFNAEKIANYIPTARSEEIIGHVAGALLGTSNDGATMLTGSYGTGKSHLATLLASLAGKTIPAEAYQPVISKLKDQDVRAKFEALMSSKPFLVLPLSGTTELSLEQQLLVGLRQALDAANIELEIESSFTSAISTLERWRRQYPATLSTFGVLLEDTDYPNVGELEKALLSFDSKALHLFIELYPKLTAGARFDLLGGDAAEVYRCTALALAKLGYKGIMLVFDEFNKVLDASVQDGQTLKTLQDLAELASRADQGFILNLVLISHRTITQYASGMKEATVTDEWRKVEGRFRIFDVSNQPWETYDIISRVLNKKRQDYYERLVDANPVIMQVSQHRRLKALLDPLVQNRHPDAESVSELVTKECLPLHPITVFLLPRISSKVAQNERTLFTFLAGQDGSVLHEVLARDIRDFIYVSPWHLYDYFEDQFSRSQEGEIKATWTRVTNALEALNENDVLEAAIIKTIGLLQFGGNVANLPCVADVLDFAFAGYHSFQHAISNLVARKLIYIKQSTGEVDIIEPVDFDVDRAVTAWLQDNHITQPLAMLRELGFEDYIVPQRYNHKKKIARFFTPVFASLEDTENLLPNGRLAPQFDGLDGVVLYLIPDNDKEMSRLAAFANSVSDRRALVVLPKKPLEIKSVIRRVAALTAIHQQLIESKMEQRALDFLELHVLDARQELRLMLDELIRPSAHTSYFWNGEELHNIVDEKTLSEKCSEIMERVFTEYPMINNELINRTTPTVTSRRARNDVIDGILNEQVNLRDNLRSAQERFMFDTIYVVTGLYDVNTSRINYSWDASFSALDFINDYFKSAKEEEVSFGPLVAALGAPPYGIRKGVLPALLAICIVKYKHYVTIADVSGKDCQINAALLDNIVDSPDSYSLKLEDWNEALEGFTVALERIFGVQGLTEAFFSNQFAGLGYEVFRWFSGLPRYARETTDASEKAVMLRRVARAATRRPRQSLLNDLPKALGFEEVTQDTVASLIDVLTMCKAELDGAIEKLLKQVAKELREFLLRFGNPRESTISLARNMVAALSIGGVSQEWASIVAFVNGFEGYDEDRFVYEFLHQLTGARVEDWLDTTRDDFLQALDSIVESVEQVATASELGPRIEVVFHGQGVSEEKLVVQQCEVSELGTMLQSHLQTTIDNFGNAISSLEKQQILINILRKVSR